MKAITIRGIEPEVAAKLKAVAKKQGKSLNQLLLEFIRNMLGLDKKKRFSREYDDLDNLFGQWSESEFTSIQGKIDQGRAIDPELWS